MINKLDSLTDIANEFSTPLSSAQNMSWYYNNKNQYSEVQPVMGGGRIKDWIGYDHSASNKIKLQLWYEKPPSGRDFFRFFYTTSDNNQIIKRASKNFIKSITIIYNGLMFTTYPKTSNLNTDYNYMMGAVGFPVAFQTDCRPIAGNGLNMNMITTYVDSCLVQVNHSLILDSNNVAISLKAQNSMKRCLHWS